MIAVCCFPLHWIHSSEWETATRKWVSSFAIHSPYLPSTLLNMIGRPVPRVPIMAPEVIFVPCTVELLLGQGGHVVRILLLQPRHHLRYRKMTRKHVRKKHTGKNRQGSLERSKFHKQTNNTKARRQSRHINEGCRTAKIFVRMFFS